jgi:hypothetical protein
MRNDLRQNEDARTMLITARVLHFGRNDGGIQGVAGNSDEKSIR